MIFDIFFDYKYQRAHKKKQVKNLHAKIKNKRKYFSHKVSNEICSTSEIVIVGDISASKLAKTRMAKSVFDVGWSQLTTMLHYKAIRHGMVVKKVSEKCSDCEAIHDRTTIWIIS